MELYKSFSTGFVGHLWVCPVFRGYSQGFFESSYLDKFRSNLGAN